MSCPNCGSAVAESSKFCPECGAAQTPVSTDETTVIDEVGSDAGTEPSAPVASPASPGPASHVGGEHAGPSFVDALLPVLRAPLVVVTALAVALALLFSLVLSTIAYALVTLVVGDDTPDGAGDWWDFAWGAHFQTHQVPLTNDESTFAVSPILFIVIAIASCWAAVQLARRIFRTTPLAADVASHGDPAVTAAQPRTLRDRIGIWAFAITYAIANLVVGAFGPDDTGIHALLGLLLPLAIAWLGYRLAARVAPLDPAAPDGAVDAAAAAATTTATSRRRSWDVVRIPLVVLAAMIVIASAAALVANVIEVTTDDDIDVRPTLTFDVVHLLDQGWTTVAYGMFGRTVAETSDDRDDDRDERGDRDREDREDDRERRIWDLREDTFRSGGTDDVGDVGTLPSERLNAASYVIVLLAGFGTVLLGGLYAGFRVVRDTRRGTDVVRAALTGAIVGPVWALATVVLSLVVTDRLSFESGPIEAVFTTVDGVEIFFLSLLVGAALGAIGGLLAANANTARAGAANPASPVGHPG